eukprot:745970-Hanusia_phi.AAC.2
MWANLQPIQICQGYFSLKLLPRRHIAAAIAPPLLTALRDSPTYPNLPAVSTFSSACSPQNFLKGRARALRALALLE